MCDLASTVMNANASVAQQAPESQQPADLQRLFDNLFAESENTRLIRGEDEPIYLPAGDGCDYHQVVFAHGFFSSALHEIAHWCIAGVERRRLVDYGYWYAPDGRTAQQQQAFEQVEVKPQALEWLLSDACGKRFRISADNLSGEATDSGPFKAKVYEQALNYCQRGLPPRAARLYTAMVEIFDSGASLNPDRFTLEQLG